MKKIIFLLFVLSGLFVYTQQITTIHINESNPSNNKSGTFTINSDKGWVQVDLGTVLGNSSAQVFIELKVDGTSLYKNTLSNDNSFKTQNK